MSTPMGAKITEHFAESIDPRVERTRLHPVLDMLVAKAIPTLRQTLHR